MLYLKHWRHLRLETIFGKENHKGDSISKNLIRSLTIWSEECVMRLIIHLCSCGRGKTGQRNSYFHINLNKSGQSKDMRSMSTDENVPISQKGRFLNYKCWVAFVIAITREIPGQSAMVGVAKTAALGLKLSVFEHREF